MAIWGFGRKKTSLRAVIDVGSHMLRAVVFEIGSNNDGPGVAPRIIRKASVKIPFSSKSERLGTILREFIFSIVKHLEKIPHKITVGVGSGFAETQMADWNLRSGDNPISIPREKLGLYFQNLLEEHKDPKKPILAYPADVLLNGYPLAEIFSGTESSTKTALEIPPKGELSFRTMVMQLSDEVGRALLESKKSLGGMPIGLVPIVAVEHQAFVGGLGIGDAIWLDVGGEETSIVLIRDGLLVRSGAFSFGFRHFIRSLAGAIASTPSEAEDLLRQYSQGILGGGMEARVRQSAGSSAEEWRISFLKALDSFYSSGPFPSRVLLFGEGALIPEISGILRSPEWLSSFSYANTPDFKLLGAESIFGGNTLKGIIKGPGEMGLAALIFYAVHYESLF